MAGKEIEQEIKLKDGRILYKTNNGFKCWLKSSGPDLEVTQEYYSKANRCAKFVK